MSMRSLNHNRGFSLIEVLIALLVLAVGLLGMASLMLTSMQSNEGAAQRSAAVVLAYDLVERMRSNRDQAIQASSLFDGDPAAATDPCLSDDCSAGMTPAQLAEHDLVQWADEMTTALPGAAAVIVQQATTSEYCIAIFWPVNQTDLVADDAAACGEDANGRAFTTLEVTL